MGGEGAIQLGCRMDKSSDHAKGLTLSKDLARTVGGHENVLFDKKTALLII